MTILNVEQLFLKGGSMEPVPVNYVSVLGAAVFSMVLGSVWYGPLLGSAWMKEMGYKSGKTMQDAMKKSMGMTYGLMFVGSLVMAWVLSHSMVFSGMFMKTDGISTGLMTGFFSWLGFVAPTSLGTVLWDGKSWKLWKINAGYYLLSLLGMGFILGMWQ